VSRHHDPVTRSRASESEARRVTHSSRLATGTLACRRCDAPVALGGPVSPAAPLTCPYCSNAGAVRDFLSLAPPTRPARVVVRVVGGPRPVVA
jgi:hypothetical protein